MENFERVEGWLNETPIEGSEATNGDLLRAFIENVYKFVAELLYALGEWPIK